MIAMVPATFRPHMAPALAARALAPRRSWRMAQSTPGSAVKSGVVGLGLLSTGFAAVSAYVGFRLGMKDKGVPKYIGYGVGIVSGLTALMGIVATVAAISIPVGTPAPKAAAPQPQMTQAA